MPNIDQLDVKPGTTSFHALRVGETPMGELSLPLTVMRGAKPGPTVTIISGIHACEYVGPVTCMRLPLELDPSELSGTVLIVPVVNGRSLEMRTPFVNPQDLQNLNRIFPGNRYGTISEQIVYAVFEELVRGADAFFDLHGGDLYEAVPPHVCFQRVGDAEVDGKSEALAGLFEIELLNIMGEGIDDLTSSVDEQGTSFTGLPSGITSTGNAAAAGVPSVLLEVGGAGTLDPELVELELRGFMNVFRHLGMLPGDGAVEIPHTPCYGMYILKSRHGGVFFADVVPGDTVEEGQRIGEMRNLRNEVVAEFHSPLSGVVLMMYTTPVRTSGETLLILARTDA